jgi:hypothetical protein
LPKRSCIRLVVNVGLSEALIAWLSHQPSGLGGCILSCGRREYLSLVAAVYRKRAEFVERLSQIRAVAGPEPRPENVARMFPVRYPLSLGVTRRNQKWDAFLKQTRNGVFTDSRELTKEERIPPHEDKEHATNAGRKLFEFVLDRRNTDGSLAIIERTIDDSSTETNRF